ncbi:hypothetical protein [Streptomyces noursei]|uniref:hypothetical protein n=1 Tax=Streptomyces noursei TaxID=1971 RepID=UPI0037F4C28A
MPGRVSDPHTQRPTVVVGEVDCEVATSALLAEAGLNGAAGYLVVTVPVTVRSAPPRADLDLVVSALLHTPRGLSAPAAWAPEPSVEYAEGQSETSVKVSVTPGIGGVSGGVDRTARRKELVSDVVGVGTRRLEWTIPGRGARTAGNRTFRFFVREDEARHAWLELSAQVSPPRTLLRRTPAQAAEGRVRAPLVAESAPQAATTLVLFDGERTERDGGAAPLYIGRPLDLPLTLTPDGPAVGSPGIGSLRWFDSVDGRPGYQWVQQSPARVVLDGGPEVHPGTAVFVPDGAVLRFPGGNALRVGYDGTMAAGRPTLREALGVQVLLDGTEVALHQAETRYVTVGRALKDINVNRPDISRLHGAFELTDTGWSYTHLSTAAATHLRPPHSPTTVARDATVDVRSGDTLVLNAHVSLSLT